MLATSMGARSEPLMLFITTAGFDRHSICWEYYDYAKKVIDGSIIDPAFYAVIYEAPMDADWTDEAVWRLANPALEDFRALTKCGRSPIAPRKFPPAEYLPPPRISISGPNKASGGSTCTPGTTARGATGALAASPAREAVLRRARPLDAR